MKMRNAMQQLVLLVENVLATTLEQVNWIFHISEVIFISLEEPVEFHNSKK